MKDFLGKPVVIDEGLAERSGAAGDWTLTPLPAVEIAPEALERMNKSLNDGLNNGTIRFELQRDGAGRIVGCNLVSVPQQELSPWPRPIPVSERLPETDSWCLFFADNEWWLGLHDGTAWQLEIDGRYKTLWMGNTPTHWLPLPPKPGGSSNDSPTIDAV